MVRVTTRATIRGTASNGCLFSSALPVQRKKQIVLALETSIFFALPNELSTDGIREGTGVEFPGQH